MTALSAERQTVRMGPSDPSYNGLEPQFPDTGEPGLEVAATTKIWAGSLVCRDASGNIVPGSVSTALVAIGCATETVDNTAGGAGDKLVQVRSGTFRWGNSAAGEAIAAAQIGDICYVVDDQTVSKTSNGGTRSPAGIVYGVDATGVWVYTSHAISCLCIELVAQAALIAAGMQVQKKTVTVGHADLTDAVNGEAQAINIGTALPANARIVGRELKLATPFTGGGAVSVALDIGTAGDVDAIVAAADVLSAAVDGQASTNPSGIAPQKHLAAGGQLLATFKPDGAHTLDGLTAGSIVIDVLYVVLA